MQNDTLKATVQYGDFDGTVAADHHDQISLNNLAAKHGIDTDKYFVYGIDIFLGESLEEKPGKAYVSILALDTDTVGAKSFDGIQDYINNNQGILPYIEFGIEASLEEVLIYFKRFNIVLKKSRFKNINQYKLTDF